MGFLVELKRLHQSVCHDSSASSLLTETVFLIQTEYIKQSALFCAIATPRTSQGNLGKSPVKQPVRRYKYQGRKIRHDTVVLPLRVIEAEKDRDNHIGSIC